MHTRREASGRRDQGDPRRTEGSRRDQDKVSVGGHEREVAVVWVGGASSY